MLHIVIGKVENAENLGKRENNRVIVVISI